MGLPYVASQNPKIIDFELGIDFRVICLGSHFIGMEYPWVLHLYEVGTRTDNSKVDSELKIDDFRILARYIRKPHGGSDGYRSLEQPQNLKIWAKLWFWWSQRFTNMSKPWV